MAEPLVIAAYFRHRDDIAKLADPRFYPIGWIDGQVWAGRIQLLADDYAVIGFEVKRYPGGALEIHGMFAAGAMGSIMGLIERAEQIGRELGCVVATIESRAGWAKALKPKGYRLHQTRIQKDL